MKLPNKQDVLKKIKITIFIITIPLILLLINKLFALYYDNTYRNIKEGVTSAKYEIVKINIIGKLTKINSFYDFESYSLNKDKTIKIIDSEKEYSTNICLDTILLEFKFRMNEYISGSERDDDYVSQDTYVTIDEKGKIISKIKIDSVSPKLKNCIILENKIPTIKKWKNESQFISLKHFLKTGFSPCFLPKFSLGISNVNGTCETWDGVAYFDITFKNEKLKLKLFNKLRSLIGVDKFDFGDLTYYQMPKKYSEKLNVNFLIQKDTIYIIKQK